VLLISCRKNHENLHTFSFLLSLPLRGISELRSSTGIVPDIEVKPSIKGILEGRDEPLEKAIEIISKKQN
jgi:hypothetical protein